MSAALDNLISKLDGVKKEGAGYKALCPVHRERTPSLDVRDGEVGVVIRCFGCGADAKQVCAAVGMEVGELFYNPSRNGREPAKSNGATGNQPHLTLAQFAQAKKLPLGYLREEGLVDHPDGAVVIGYFDLDGREVPRQRVRAALAAKDGSSWLGPKGISPICYGRWHRANDRARSRTVFVCEGESDTLVFRFCGYPALGIPGAQNTSALAAEDIEGIDALFITQDADAAGAKFVAGVRKRVAGFGFKGKICALQPPDGYKDFGDLWIADPDIDRFRLKVDTLTTKAAPGLTFASLDTIESRAVEWVWNQVLPASKLNDLEGNPGDGKTLVLADFIARASTGAAWPDGSPGGEPCNVLLLSGEDDLADTIRPRLEAARADLSRVHILISGSPTFPEDTAALETAIRKYGVRLVGIDPIDPFLNADIDSHKNADVRRALAELRAVAEATRCTLILVRHLNKDTKTTNALYRGSGSIAFTASTRAAFLIARTPDDPEVRVFAGIKCNLSPLPQALSFKIVEQILPGGIKTQKVEWLGAVELTSRELLSEPEPVRRGPKGEKREKARALVSAFLADGLEHPSADLDKAAEAAGVTKGTIWQARKDLGVRARKPGFAGDWLISLPSATGESMPESATQMEEGEL